MGIDGDLATVGPRHKSLTEVVTDRIARAIITGAFPSGHRLTEIGLAEQLGVSRSPVREALRALSREGLVELLPRRGAQVAEVTVDGAVSLYACRMLLEPTACRLAVDVIDGHAITTLQTLLD